MTISATVARIPRVAVLLPGRPQFPKPCPSTQEQGAGEPLVNRHPAVEPEHNLSAESDKRICLLPYTIDSLPELASGGRRFIVVQPDTRLDPRGLLVKAIREVFTDCRLLVWDDPAPLQPVLDGGISENAAWNLFASRLAGPQLEITAGNLLVGRSPAFRQVTRAIERTLDQSQPLLIQGEAGTGKRQLALALHQRSDRRDLACWTVDCGQLTDDLQRRILFGDGAQETGLLNQEGVGSIVFRELGLLPPRIQPCLLKWIRDNRQETQQPQLFFTTSHDLGRLVADHRMRADLFFELSGNLIGLPPLRQRRDDIDLLVDHFCQCLAPAIRLETLACTTISQPLRKLLRRQPWPGNVTALRNCVVDLLLNQSTKDVGEEELTAWLATHTQLPNPEMLASFSSDADQPALPFCAAADPGHQPPPAPHLSQVTMDRRQPAELQPGTLQPGTRDVQTNESGWAPLVDQIAAASPTNLYARALETFERGLLREAMRRSGGNLTQAARLLGITSVSLKNKLRHLSIDI